MNASVKPRGTWWLRTTIRLLTIALALLTFSVLGFLVDDIRTAPGPDRATVMAQYVDASLLDQHKSLRSELEDLQEKTAQVKEQRRLLDSGSSNLQQTLNQLIELQRNGIESGQDGALLGQQDFSDSVQLFLQNQRQSQGLIQSVSELTKQQHALEAQIESIDEQVLAQRKPAKVAYAQLLDTHRLKLAMVQLAVLLPLLGLAGWLMLRNREKPFFPLFLAVGIATLVKVAMVMHQYFPSRYFKYVLIAVLLVVVVRLLMSLINSTHKPAREALFKQYREAYERFLCPVCEYPIRTGPRRFLFWNRSTVNKVVVPAENQPQENYCCPACSQTLYEECSQCQQPRHSLLPSCSHCGDTRELSGDTATD